MTTRQLEFASEALEQAQAVIAWWRENRPAAPGLFLDELDAATSTMLRSPKVGRSHRGAGVPGLRRMLLPRTRYHVYYTYDDTRGVLRIHAIWHCARGAGPALA